MQQQVQYVGGKQTEWKMALSTLDLRNWKKQKLDLLRYEPNHRTPAEDLAINEALSLKYPYERRDPAHLPELACEFYAVVNETIFHADLYEDAGLDVMAVRQWYLSQIDRLKEICPAIPGTVKDALSYIEQYAPHLMLQQPNY
jgi:hypothetical protein